MARRRWFQFSLKSLMAVVAVICLGFGGWHLLLKYGQYVEAEPAVVGKPITIRGRFFRFFAWEHSGHYDLSVDYDPDTPAYFHDGFARKSGWGIYEVESNMGPVDEPSEFTMTLTPDGGSPIRGSFVVRGAK